MIFVRYSVGPQWSDWPTVPPSEYSYFDIDTFDSLPKILQDPDHLRPIKEVIDSLKQQGETSTGKHPRLRKVSIIEGLLGSDVSAHARTFSKSAIFLDRLRARLITDYIITGQPSVPAEVELNVYAAAFADAAHAVGLQGSSGDAQVRQVVRLPGGRVEEVKAQIRSQVSAAESTGFEGGATGGTVGANLGAQTPNFAAEGPREDSKTEPFVFTIDQFPARISIRTTFRLATKNFMDLNFALAGIVTDHELSVRQPPLIFMKPFANPKLVGDTAAGFTTDPGRSVFDAPPPFGDQGVEPRPFDEGQIIQPGTDDADMPPDDFQRPPGEPRKPEALKGGISPEPYKYVTGFTRYPFTREVSDALSEFQLQPEKLGAELLAQLRAGTLDPEFILRLRENERSDIG